MATVGLGGERYWDDAVTTWPGKDGTWQVSDGGGWVDGIFDSEATAKAAVPFAGTRALSALVERICRFDQGNRAITAVDLMNLSR